jgi:hypothetical protein
MPIGLILLHWDSRFGGDPKMKLPESLVMENKDMMQIYAQHEYSGKSGIVQIMTSKVNLVSFYLGRDSMNYLVLYLKEDENPEDFENVLKLVAFHFTSADSDAIYESAFKEVYQIIENYSQYTTEQKNALYFYNPLILTLFRIFQDEMVLPLSELEIMVRERVPKLLDQLPVAIELLTQAGFLNISAVKGIATDLMFQISDLVVIRRPPGEYYAKIRAAGVSESYIEKLQREAKKIFTFYKAPDSDIVNLIRKVVLNPLLFQLYNEFKTGFIPDDDLDKLEKKYHVDNLQPYIDALVNVELISIIKKPESRDYFIGLRSELTIERVYPEYHIDSLTDAYRNQKHHPDVILKGLELLKTSYLSNLQEIRKLNSKSPTS